MFITLATALKRRVLQTLSCYGALEIVGVIIIITIINSPSRKQKKTKKKQNRLSFS